MKWHLLRLICESSIENTSHSCLRFAFQRTLISFIIGSKLWPLDVLFLLGINMKFDHIVTWYDEHKKVEEFIYLISFPYLKKRAVSIWIQATILFTFFKITNYKFSKIIYSNILYEDGKQSIILTFILKGNVNNRTSVLFCN